MRKIMKRKDFEIIWTFSIYSHHLASKVNREYLMSPCSFANAKMPGGLIQFERVGNVLKKILGFD